MQCRLQDSAFPRPGPLAACPHEKQICREPGHLVRRLFNRCERGAHQLGHGDTVEANDRQVVRDLQTEFVGDLESRDCEDVATGEVTIGVPSSFPGADAPVVIAPHEVIW